MDALFEGMDLVMSVETGSQFEREGGHEDPIIIALEAAPVAQDVHQPEAPVKHIEGGHKDPIIKAVEAAPPVAQDVPKPVPPIKRSLSMSGPDVGPSPTSPSPALGPSRSLSPANVPLPTFGDRSEPLDENLFSGLTLSALGDESVDDESKLGSDNAIETNSENGMPAVDNLVKTSVESIQRETSAASDDPFDGLTVQQEDMDRESIASNAGSADISSVMKNSPSFNAGSEDLSSVLKNPPSGAAVLSRTNSDISSGTSPQVKRTMRRKKRTMKIGYGREEEENAELGLRKVGTRDVLGANLLGQETVNGNSISSPKLAVSREESTLGSLEVGELPRSNGLDLDSDSRLSSSSQYSTLEVGGIERLESRALSIDKTFLEIDENGAISLDALIGQVDEQELQRNGQVRKSTREEAKPAIEVASGLPINAGRELGSDAGLASELPNTAGSEVISDVEGASEPLSTAVEEIKAEVRGESKPSSTAVEEINADVKGESEPPTTEDIKVEVEGESEPPSTVVEEIMAHVKWDPSTAAEGMKADMEGNSQAPGTDPEVTSSIIATESPQQELGGSEENVLQSTEDSFLDKLQLSEGTVEERLEFVKEAVAHTLKALQDKISAASVVKKAAVQKRRRAAEKVAAASARYRELEAELEAACEKEDFEKADSLSSLIPEAEASMAQAAEALGVAESESDSAALKVVDILDLQVAVEENGATFLELLKQEAEDTAEKTYKEDQEIAGREQERLEAEENSLDIRRKDLDLEIVTFQEQISKLGKLIEDQSQSEIKERASLSEKRDQLAVELEELLRLVRMKEAEIAEYDSQIAAVDEKISSVAATFNEQKVDLESQQEAFANAAINLERDAILIGKHREGLEKLLADAEGVRSGLEISAKLAHDEAKNMRDGVKIKRSVALAIIESRKKVTELAEKEKLCQAEVQLLRQNAGSSRALLQERISAKAKLSQDLSAVKEHIASAEKRGPELDNEKKLAAAARNFKVAARLAAEAKALNEEKEAAIADMVRMTNELEKVEKEAEVKLSAMAELDNLVAAKEKEGAMARCERLHLVATATRNERDIAIELDDYEEAESINAEALAADTEAESLQKLYGLVGNQYKSSDAAAADADADADADTVPMEEEAAMVEYKRLQLEASSLRDQLDAAIERDEFDEAETLHSKIEIADAEADRLQKLYQLEDQQVESEASSKGSQDLALKGKESAIS